MIRYDKLRFGTAGTPLSAPTRTRQEGVITSAKLGLSCMELEFVRGVNLKEEAAREVKHLKEHHNIELTAHGPYYINLNAKEREKQEASINRILATARITHLAGGKSITFHAGFYLGMNKEKVYNTIKQQLKRITRTLHEENNPVRVSPELTGKPTQFGDLNELIRLAQDVEGVGVCIDYAHAHARSNGKYNTIQEFRDILTRIEQGLGREALNAMHIHMSGIAYNGKGEQYHLVLKESDLKWEDIIRTWKEYKIKGCVISESPNLEGDALLLQKKYHEL